VATCEPPLARDTVDIPAGTSHAGVLAPVLGRISGLQPPVRLKAVGHRVTHGGTRFRNPVLVDRAVMDGLERLSAFAPLHLPPQLQAMRALLDSHPDCPQVACFDTAFHADMPAAERRFALPRELAARGIVRYGFHGLSYQYIASVLGRWTGAPPDARVVVAHLGHGASLCAMRDGHSVATTMSFSPLDGIPASTRSGALDPAVVLHLLREGLTPAVVERLLWHESGLLGVSGESDDMRDLLASDRPEAAEAVELFVHRVVREIGAMAAALEGLDVLVFTGGIGEHSAVIRRRVLSRLGWLGLVLDAAANDRGGPCITMPGAASGWVIPTNEELVIARETLRVIGAPATP
jgi:acetate kinase